MTDLTPQQLAVRLGCSTRLLQKWRTAGVGPHYIKEGRIVRYRLAAVEAWELSRERASTASAHC